MTIVYLVWLLFAAIFYYYAYVHWRQSGEDLRPFRFRERGPSPEAGEGESGLEMANVDFAHDFNMYLQKVNDLNRARNRASAVGFFVAGSVSVLSLLLQLFTQARG